MVAKSGARKSRSSHKEIRNLASKSLKSKEAGSVKGGKRQQASDGVLAGARPVNWPKP
jgi:hypothetical protein